MRTPVYAKNNPAFRISSVANDLWRVQQHDNFKGTKTADPWGNISPPMTKDEALAVLARHHIEKKAA